MSLLLLPPLLPKPQISLNLSSLIPIGLSPSPTLTIIFSRKPPSTILSTTSPRSSSSFHFSPQQLEFDDDEHVVGDCVVFEEGAFEDPYLRENFDSASNFPKKKSNKSSVEVKPENLVPDKWKDVQAEINITKKEKRRIAQELEFGSRVEKRKQGLVPIRNVSEEDYVAYRDKKLSQLNPIILDNPRFPDEEDEEEEREDDSSGSTSNSRVTPRNPRLAVYGATMDDISEFFSSGDYDPKVSRNPEGLRKMFTKEEKALMNRRIPELSSATSDKWLPLHTLAASGEFYLVNALLKHNVDINIQDKDGLTALHKAILSKKQAIFNYLLRESANPFVRDKEGATLMHYAVRTASSQMIKILLLYNVDINIQDNDGWTPLHLAVQTRRTDIVRLLLIKGADKTLQNQDGLTPLDLCLYSGQDTRTFELIKLMKQLPKPQKQLQY